MFNIIKHAREENADVAYSELILKQQHKIAEIKTRILEKYKAIKGMQEAIIQKRAEVS